MLYGGTYEIVYDNGHRVNVIYHDAGRLSWNTPEGDSGTEKTTTVALGSATYFLSWVEESGTAVSQVIDLTTGRTHSVVSTWSPTARLTLLYSGRIKKLTADLNGRLR